MIPQLPDDLRLDSDLCRTLEAYRAYYLEFFLRHFESHCPRGYKGGCFNINSVTGRPYDHHYCYSWTDGRSLGELAVAHLADLGPRDRLRRYADHLYQALRERYDLNGYFPHVVDDRTNLAVADSMNVRLEPGASSFSHTFALNGMCQYGLVFGSDQALALALRLLDELRRALREDRFIEGAAPRPPGQRAQGPFMISLGVLADALETLARRFGRDSTEFRDQAAPLIALGQECLDYILAHHYRPEDHAFWEVNQDGSPLRNDQGQVVTDPGHTIEFTGFAARFAGFLEPPARAEVIAACRAIFLWAAQHGFHPTRDLIYKSIDRDTGAPLRNESVADISRVVSEKVLQEHFGGRPQAARLATFPWWIPMELLAAGSLLRRGDSSGRVDGYLVRALKGLFRYYCSERIEGLCYQNIGDGFFDYVDIPPATATLDLMHSHRSLRVFLREVGVSAGGDA